MSALGAPWGSGMPRLLIAGVCSGVGKTSIAVGLIRALRQRGARVVPFKCGPDYLDPTYLSRAAGRPCHNLDGWMMGRQAVVDTFVHASADADIAVIEGVMGLFDGASPTTEDGSSAQLGKWLGAPVVLVVDASGMARSIAAVAHGFANFDPELRVQAVLANRVGSRGHQEILQAALGETPLLGALEGNAALAFPERHLGLRTADSETISEELLDAWGEEVARGFDLKRLLSLAASAPRLSASALAPSLSKPWRPAAPVQDALSEPVVTPSFGDLRAPSLPRRVACPERARCRIGLAFDAAFHFYYADNLRRLEALGAALVHFSPIDEHELPEVDGLLIGGGYPEMHAARLAQNEGLKRAIWEFAESGKPIYAECGGLMYLAQSIRTLDGEVHPMVGLIPTPVDVSERLVALGYVEVETRSPSLLGPRGTRFRGHQFRYSSLRSPPGAAQCAYTIRRRRGGDPQLEGYSPKDNVLASYVHAHWASNPAIAENLVLACAEREARDQS